MIKFTRREILFLCALAVGILCAILWLDYPVASLFAAFKQLHPEIIKPFQRLTILGESQWYLYPTGIFAILTGAVCWFKPRLRPLLQKPFFQSLFIFVSVAGSGLTVNGLKILIGRPRPVLLIEDGIFNQFTPFILASRWWSLPSGHSTTALALALAMMWLWPRGRWFWLLFAALIGASRVIVTAHYLGDMLAGFLIAIIFVTAMQQLFAKRKWLSPSDRKAACRESSPFLSS
jgi:membrane-associated phospholipid phosphatase